MFENLVAGSIEPELIKILRAVDAALGGVKTRLEEQLHGNDLVAALSAGVQLDAIAAWQPALTDIIGSLTPKATAAPAPHSTTPLGHGH